ncbi:MULTISPECIES: hypothetical protein [Lonsdalea]|uniref:hypothetical protein n=1 Tax=Lonsdalea TaxID=1082702 RepID=UPI0011608D52|nr:MULTISPECIES: hypothetical protein [Lonsdalea]
MGQQALPIAGAIALSTRRLICCAGYRACTRPSGGRSVASPTRSPADWRGSMRGVSGWAFDDAGAG